MDPVYCYSRDKDVVNPSRRGGAKPGKLPVFRMEKPEGVNKLKFIQEISQDRRESASLGGGHFVQLRVIDAVEIATPNYYEVRGI